MSAARDPQTILLATGNPGKLREIQAEMADLPVRWRTLADFPAIIPPQETGDTFAANADLKAVYYSNVTGLWTLADDSGLVVDALGGAPGVHSARYAGPAQNDASNNARLLAELGDRPAERRTARFRCALSLADGERILLRAEGAIEGVIGKRPRGSNGFGYDPLFYVPAIGCTTAELPPDRKNAISHRGQAVRKLHVMLKELLESMSGL
ncbi:MAG: dITP/XTP pyrophosphatase [Phycisphaerae bacterium]|nr:dITP/XTP pyrophosphatase [Phycisphaerae bacterium]